MPYTRIECMCMYTCTCSCSLFGRGQTLLFLCRILWPCICTCMVSSFQWTLYNTSRNSVDPNIAISSASQLHSIRLRPGRHPTQVIIKVYNDKGKSTQSVHVLASALLLYEERGIQFSWIDAWFSNISWMLAIMQIHDCHMHIHKCVRYLLVYESNCEK